MEKSPRLTHSTLKVLRMFMENPARDYAGSEISKAAGVWSGTLYPMLARLEVAGWLTSEWESIDPRQAGRPRKRFYKITALGQRSAQDAFAQLDLARGGKSWITT
jgi:PadR family transcriptional regulator